MRHTIHIAPGVGFIHGTWDHSQNLLTDRIVNGDAFPGETRIRLPRSFKMEPWKMIKNSEAFKAFGLNTPKDTADDPKTLVPFDRIDRLEKTRT